MRQLDAVSNARPTSATTPESTPSTGAPSRTRLNGRVFLASVAVTMVPVAVATIRAIHRGWIPLSDDAFFTIRARDVLSYHNFPLVGTFSSATLGSTAVLHHPGPLLFEALALPVQLFGGAAGVAVGIGLLNLAAVAGVAWFAYRRGGPVLGTMAMLITAALCWSMGSEALFEPWQPYSMLLPFLCFAVLAWSVACGDLLALPFAVGVSSLVLQTHLSYALLVPTLAVFAVAALALVLRRERRGGADAWLTTRRRAQRAAAAAGVVLTVCWVPPLIDQFFGQGNLSRLLQSASPPKGVVGYHLGTQVVASVVSLPPFWSRSAMQHTLILARGWRPPSLALAIGSLLALAAVLAGCAWLARRSHDRVALCALGTAAIGVLAGLGTAGRVPVTAFGLEAHVFWWLWPLGAFVFFAIAATVARRVVPARVPASLLIGLLAVGTTVVAALDLPTSLPILSPNAREDAVPAARAVDAQMGRLEGKGPILVDQLLLGRLADPYGVAFIAELQRRGIPFVTNDPELAANLGPARRYTGTNARSVLYFTVGHDPLKAPPGTPRVAHHEGLTPPELRERAQLTAQIVAYIAAGHLQLDRRGQTAVRHGAFPTLAAQLATGVVNADALLASGDLTTALDKGYLQLDSLWAKRFERFDRLETSWEDHTVSLFLEPLGARHQPRTP